MYCPYTDKQVELEEASFEHIIPKSLGGSNSFGIQVEKEANSKLGAEVDGKMAADFFISQRRNEWDIRGHSGKRPVPRYKGVLEPGSLPIQLDLDKGERKLDVFSPKHGRLLRSEETMGKNLSFTTTLDPVLWVRFAAKVALAAGYLTYGDRFVDCVEHRPIREFMWNPDISGNPMPFAAGHLLTEPESQEERQLRALTEVFGTSVVILVPRRKSLTVAVGCLGRFVARVSLDADTASFPNTGVYSWGHVLAVRQGKLTRGSVVGALRIVKDFSCGPA